MAVTWSGYFMNEELTPSPSSNCARCGLQAHGALLCFECRTLPKATPKGFVFGILSTVADAFEGVGFVTSDESVPSEPSALPAFWSSQQ